MLILCTIVSSPLFAKQQKEKVKPVKKSAIIFKDSSELEISVARILQDTLTKLGYKVKEEKISNIGKEKPSSYKISIIFSAINTDKEVDPRIDTYINAKVDTTSKIVLFNVYGNIYEKKGEDVDAETQASKELHPDLIVRQILRSLKL
jgi:hypothetical protein